MILQIDSESAGFQSSATRVAIEEENNNLKPTKVVKCVVCKKLNPKYTCPRCKIPYCSSEHYRNHNLFCSEQFFKKQVQQELKNTKAAPEERKKMKEILEKEAQIPEQIPDDHFVKRYQQILEQIEKGEEVILKHHQEVEFAKFIENWVIDQGEKQFWEVEDGLFLYLLEGEEHDPFETDHQEIVKSRVELRKKYKSVLPFKGQYIKINATPSPDVPYHILALVYSMALVHRYFNGDVKSEPEKVAATLLKICPLLDSSAKAGEIPSVAQAILHVQQALQAQNKELRYWKLVCLHDVVAILKNKLLVLETLMRMHDMKWCNNQDKQAKRKGKQIVKKLQFMVSYAKEFFGPDVQNKLLPDINEIIRERKQRFEEQEMIAKVKSMKINKI